MGKKPQGLPQGLPQFGKPGTVSYQVVLERILSVIERFVDDKHSWYADVIPSVDDFVTHDHWPITEPDDLIVYVSKLCIAIGGSGEYLSEKKG